jgi:hypothetical protein
VLATLRQTWTIIEGGVEQVVGYTPTFFPGTPAVSDARRVTLRVGEQVNNADFSMIRGRGASVSGFAFDSQGRPLGGDTVYLGLESPGTGSKFNESAGPIVGGDGTFTIKNLAPGDTGKRSCATRRAKGLIRHTAGAPLAHRRQRRRPAGRRS